MDFNAAVAAGAFANSGSDREPVRVGRSQQTDLVRPQGSGQGNSHTCDAATRTEASDFAARAMVQKRPAVLVPRVNQQRGPVVVAGELRDIGKTWSAGRMPVC